MKEFNGIKFYNREDIKNLIDTQNDWLFVQGIETYCYLNGIINSYYLTEKKAIEKASDFISERLRLLKDFDSFVNMYDDWDGTNIWESIDSSDRSYESIKKGNSLSKINGFFKSSIFCFNYRHNNQELFVQNFCFKQTEFSEVIQNTKRVNKNLLMIPSNTYGLFNCIYTKKEKKKITFNKIDFVKNLKSICYDKLGLYNIEAYYNENDLLERAKNLGINFNFLKAITNKEKISNDVESHHEVSKLLDTIEDKIKGKDRVAKEHVDKAFDKLGYGATRESKNIVNDIECSENRENPSIDSILTLIIDSPRPSNNYILIRSVLTEYQYQNKETSLPSFKMFYTFIVEHQSEIENIKKASQNEVTTISNHTITKKKIYTSFRRLKEKL